MGAIAHTGYVQLYVGVYAYVQGMQVLHAWHLSSQYVSIHSLQSETKTINMHNRRLFI